MNRNTYTLWICLLFLAISLWISAAFEKTIHGRRLSQESVNSAVSAACGVTNTSMFRPISADCNKYTYVQKTTLQCPPSTTKIACHSKFREGLPTPADIFQTVEKSEPITRYQTESTTRAFLQLLEKTHQIFKKRNITYVMMRGTLMSAVRHHGLNPWDDDMDIAVEPGMHDYIFNISQDFTDAGLSIMKASRLSIIKVWNTGSPFVTEKMKWGWPHLDVWDFFKCGTASWKDHWKPASCNPIDSIIPPRLAYFEGYSFWIPRSAFAVANNTYKNFDKTCMRKPLVHRNREKVERLTFECKDLRPYYHFVTSSGVEELPFQMSSSDLLDILINLLFHHGVEFDVSDNSDNQFSTRIQTSTLSLAGSTIHYVIDIEFEVGDDVTYGFVVVLTGGKQLPLAHYESDIRIFSLELEIVGGYEIKSGVHRELMRRAVELSSYSQKLKYRWIFHIVWNAAAMLVLIF